MQELSPRFWARLGGVLYLIIIVVGISGEVFVRGRLIVPDDPAATAERIRSSELLWRAGLASELFMLACAVVLVLVFYVLLRPVNRDLALLAAFFNLVSITLEASNKVHLIATLFPLGNKDYLKAFEPAQLYALAYNSTRAHALGYGVNLIFFGFVCVVLGYLIFRSGYLPKVIGVLMLIAGPCYLLNSFSILVAPAFGSHVLPFVAAPILLGEGSVCLWLLLKGVNMERWSVRTKPVPTAVGAYRVSLR